ncbi:NAD(P)/FAD-dependent oxidoreductase [Sporosarcina siberiensis]|uniref:NAD(P)/FAD-dependent oxidoreductase n=1 Tax=Sporosarcina siberiensis TaxID=1365606 RepID=A0ABW4SK51_9BACL
METDVLIIGGGPAGLSAALYLASNGLMVTIVDESTSIGGQLRQQTQLYTNLPLELGSQKGFTIVETLINKLVLFNVVFLTKHTMVGVYKDGTVGVSNGQKVFPIHAEKIIITTGAAEEAAIFPGWTLPGIMTIGAAQILMNREFVYPGKNAVILGSNNFSLEVAKQLQEVGVNIHGIIESENEIQGDNSENIKYLTENKINIYCNTSIVHAIGKGSVEKVLLDIDGKLKSLDVDLICVGVGISPILETIEVLSCQMAYKKELGGWVPNYDENLETSISSVYVAGNTAGITSLEAILLTGKIAGTSVLASLGKLTENDADKVKRQLWKKLYVTESTKSKGVFEARLSLIADFQVYANRKKSGILDSVLEESLNG